MIFTFVHRAEPDTVFARNAFDGSIGKTIRVNLFGRRDRDGTLVKAEVSEDGRSVELTCEVDDSSETAGILNPRYDSRDIGVGFTAPADEAKRWPGGEAKFTARSMAKLLPLPPECKASGPQRQLWPGYMRHLICTRPEGHAGDHHDETVTGYSYGNGNWWSR